MPGKGARGAGLLNVAANDGKSGATATAAATTTQADAAALANAQAALTPSNDAATAAYKQAADAAAHAVAPQAASASSTVSSAQGSIDAATSAAIAPHVGSSGWDDVFSQKVVFLSNAKQTSAKLTLNPKDLGPVHAPGHRRSRQ